MEKKSRKPILRRVLKISIIVIVVAFIVGQFIRPDFSNPPVVPSETLAASTVVPADVQMVITRSCGDCHSNETQYPWYSKVTPFNWYLSNHINEGRREMNFSVWNTYPAKKKLRKLEELCEQIEHGEMPLPSYLWIHQDAALTDSDRTLLCDWSKAESTRLSAEAPPAN